MKLPLPVPRIPRFVWHALPGKFSCFEKLFDSRLVKSRDTRNFAVIPTISITIYLVMTLLYARLLEMCLIIVCVCVCVCVCIYIVIRYSIIIQYR